MKRHATVDVMINPSSVIADASRAVDALFSDASASPVELVRIEPVTSWRSDDS